MKRLLTIANTYNAANNSVLRAYGMDYVGIELEYASTAHMDNIDKSVWSNYYLNHLTETELSGSRSVVIDDDNCDRFGILTTTELHRDTSIKPSLKYDGTIEVCSPPLDISNVVTYLRILDDRAFNFTKPNSSCGTHFHFCSSKLTFAEIKKLMIGVSFFEPLLHGLSKNDRVKIKYCKPLGHFFTIDDITSISSEDELFFMLTGYEKKTATGRLNKYGYLIDQYCLNSNLNPRYSGLNVFSHLYRNSVEFRYFENVSIENNISFFTLLKAIISFCLINKTSDLIKISELLSSTPKDSYLKFIETLRAKFSFNINDKTMKKIYDEFNSCLLGNEERFDNSYKYLEKFLDANKNKGKNIKKFISEFCSNKVIGKIHENTCKTRIDDMKFIKFITLLWTKAYFDNIALNISNMEFKNDFFPARAVGITDGHTIFDAYSLSECFSSEQRNIVHDLLFKKPNLGKPIKKIRSNVYRNQGVFTA